jgi:outer membrane lipoprotein-sorting protein
MSRTPHRIGLVALLGLAAATGRAAEPPDWTASFTAIRRAAAEVDSVQAQFTQHKHLPILARPLVSEGRFVFRAPDSIRWEYLRPVRSVLLLDDGELTRHVRRDGRWVADAAARVETMRVVVSEIQGWLTGQFERSRTFTARLLPGRPARVELTPADEALGELIERIVLTLDERPGVLAQVEIVEGPEARTVLRFERVELDAAVDPQTFSAPAGATDRD